MFPYSGVIACFVISFLFYQLKDYKDTYKSWRVAKIYSRGSEYAVSQYEKLYDKLCHQPEFLFEYAQCLYDLKQYDKAIVLLERAEKLSWDPMIRCILGKTIRLFLIMRQRKVIIRRQLLYYRKEYIPIFY
ncbi:MAG: tetratricopeptide repeat protein [Tannerellaceae bacterium]|nr:tetratricopeptide repeat protein [Tannerellaceae bacterium]